MRKKPDCDASSSGLGKSNENSNCRGFAAIGAALCGCGTITQGTSQDIAIVSNPPGAQCNLIREGQTVASMLKTPGTVKVDKTKHDIILTCDLAGYQQASVSLESGYGIGTFGNIILGGGSAGPSIPRPAPTTNIPPARP